MIREPVARFAAGLRFPVLFALLAGPEESKQIS
jgi:hypothetical protein